MTFRPAVFDRDVLALDEACFLQALAERDHEVRGVSERGVPEETNNRHRRLLRARRERPRSRRAAEQRDELAPLSFDHLVGAARAALPARRVRAPWRSELDDELELGRLYDWQVRGLGALEDATGIVADLTISIRDVAP